MADGSSDRGAVATDGTTAASSSAVATTPTKASIIKRIEFLFSRDNLTADITLQYQMNYDCYVPISAVIAHPKIKELTSDAELVTEAIKSTSIVSLDDTKTYVKPAYKIPRVTLIIREIASSTPSEEIEKIFEGEDSAKPIKVKSEVGDNWYVTFANEDDMMKAFLFTKTKKFNGEPVKARIKSEILAKSFYYPVVADPQAAAAQYGYNQGQYYYSSQVPGGQHGEGGRGGRGGSSVHSSGGRYNNNPGARRPPTTKKGEYSRKPNPNFNATSTSDPQSNNGETTHTHPPRTAGQRPHYSKEHSYSSRENTPTNENSKDNAHHPRGAPKEGTTPPTTIDAANKKRTTAPRRRTGSETKQPGNHGGAFLLGTSHFPPLPSKDGNSHATGVATSGYSREFKKHTQASIVDAIKALPEASAKKPDTLPTTEECPAILQKPRNLLEISNSRTPPLNETTVQTDSQSQENTKIAPSSSPSSSSSPAASSSPSSLQSSSQTSSSLSASSTSAATTTLSSTSASSSPATSAASPSSSSPSSLWSQIVGNNKIDTKK